MATAASSAIQVELAHKAALEIVREHGSPANAGKVEYLDNLGLHLSSLNHPAHLAGAQSVLIGALATIVGEQAETLKAQAGRITTLEGAAAKPAAATKGGAKK